MIFSYRIETPYRYSDSLKGTHTDIREAQTCAEGIPAEQENNKPSVAELFFNFHQPKPVKEGPITEISDAIKQVQFGVIRNGRKLQQPVYYYSSRKKVSYGIVAEQSYIFAPSWITVERASAAELGDHVLGIAIPTLRLIKILDRLHGHEYLEVLQHEKNHVFYPHLGEQEIRYMTKRELPFTPTYH